MWSFNTAWSNFPITSGVYAIVNTLNRNIFDVIKPLDDTRNKRAVYQIDKNNDCIINEFSSIKDAAIAMGNLANRSAINRCCLGSKRTAFGFKWKYKYN